jgi:hypothetical protein
MTFSDSTIRQAARRSRFSAYFVLPLVVALSAVAGCDDDPVEPEEPEIGTMRITVGSQTLTFTEAGGPTTLTISGASTAIAATFLDPDGVPLTLDAADFELRVSPANAGVLTFTRTTAFSGTLNRVAIGTTTVELAAFHKGEGHDDFGEFVVTVTVQ